MFAIISETGTLSFGEGSAPAAAIAVPDEFVQLASIPGRLVWDGSRIADAASIERWYVAPDGTRRAYKGGEDWVEAAGRWDSPLARKPDGSWCFESAALSLRRGLRSHAARRRYQVETAGISVGGLAVPTDERTQRVLTGAYARAVADPDYAIPRWKVGEGAYVALSNAQIRAIGEAVTAHIQKCFDRNAEVDEAISAGEITTESQIEAMFAAP